MKRIGCLTHRLFATSIIILSAFLVACGGGAESSQFSSKLPANEVSRPDPEAQPQPEPTPEPEPAPEPEPTPEPAPEPEQEPAPQPEPEPAPEPAPEPTPTSDSEPVEVDGSVTLRWSLPDARVNGEALYDETGAYEIKGYEIRYKSILSDGYKTVELDDGLQETHIIGALSGLFSFEIAAYDSDGLYSEFVAIEPY